MYVKSLTWTLLLPHAKFTMVALTGIHRQRKILKIWDIFQTLTQVRALDLAYLSSDQSHPLASQFPDALFPAATTIRLSGVMHYSLAASIIAVDPSKLVHLTIDNLQQEGSQNDDSLFRQVAQRQAYHQQTLSSWNTLHQIYHNITPSTWLAGPMQNLLGSIAGCCPKLKSLTIRKVGQRHWRDFKITNSSIDQDLYSELATFIESVKGTLEHLTFEQGEEHKFCRIGPLYRIMDQRFASMLAPTLYGGQWRYLKTMTLGGVRDSDGDVASSVVLDNEEGKRVAMSVTRDAKLMDHVGDW